MSRLQPISADGFLYTNIIGTGGIGSGIFFSLAGDHTLGRNESRAATLQPYRDFCKQHIILHYITVLLGASPGGPFRVFPIGAVGNDETGKKLLQEMEQTGMDIQHIHISEVHSTLFSVCFQYPDKSGGNITTDNSASGSVSPEYIDRFFASFDGPGKRELILAAPEVPVEARIKLLQYGRKRNSFNVAAVLSAEAEQFRRMRGFEMTDLLSVNMDEARSIAKIRDENTPGKTVVNACVESLLSVNPRIAVLITDGKNGSYCYAGDSLEQIPAFKTTAVSTAGAGDAFLAGTIAGLCCGLPLAKDVDDAWLGQTQLRSAVELGTLLASLSVNSCHTIHPDADARLLHSFIKGNNLQLGGHFEKIFNKLTA